MFRRRVAAVCLLALLSQISLYAQTSDKDVLERIRKEEATNSQIMKTMHMLSDVFGARLTGSPNHEAAAHWAVKQMQAWGLENGHLEPWDFGHPGWLNERLTAHIISPVKDALVCEVVAWTPSTHGTVRGSAYQIILPEKPTQAQLTAFFEKEKNNVRHRIVLAGKHTVVPINLNPAPKRVDDKQIERRYDPDARPTPSPSPTPEDRNILTNRQIDAQLAAFLKENGALLRVNDAGREHGQIRAFNNRNFDVNTVVPTVVMRNEDYGRISRLLADGEVKLEFNVVNHVYPEGRTSYNTVAEIPGTDKRDEVVMMGAHLDSWHSATGATDNAIGCAIMMEAVRIIKTLGLKPRRTIRVALWSGEEQGLLGSKAYVKSHFGSAEAPGPDYEKFAGYFNVDTGTGRIRGAEVFGPPEAASIIREIFRPFKDEGVAGAIATRSRRAANSDYSSFNNAGLPGIDLDQDPIEYFSHTWHTNLDTYERILEDDVRKVAVLIAWSAYELANRDEMLPRFDKVQMPAKPAETPVAAPVPAKQSRKPAKRTTN